MDVKSEFKCNVWLLSDKYLKNWKELLSVRLTDVADEHDFRVSWDVLCKTRLLVVPEQTLGLAGGFGFGCSGGDIKQVEPAFCTYSNHKVLVKKTQWSNPGL